MPTRIEVALKESVRDARGERIKREIEHFLHLPVERVRTIDVYTVDAPLSPAELELAASGPFSDPVIQEWSVGQPVALTRPSATLSQGERVTVPPLPPGEGWDEGCAAASFDW